MKNLVIAIIFIISFANIANASGYCPTQDEYITNLKSYITRIKNVVINDAPPEQAEAINQEYTNYKQSIYSGCYTYFKTTPQPDCSKVKILYSGYDDLEQNKKSVAKTQIQNMYPDLSKVCPIDTQILKLYMNKNSMPF